MSVLYVWCHRQSEAGSAENARRTVEALLFRLEDNAQFCCHMNYADANSLAV